MDVLLQRRLLPALSASKRFGYHYDNLRSELQVGESPTFATLVLLGSCTVNAPKAALSSSLTQQDMRPRQLDRDERDCRKLAGLGCKRANNTIEDTCLTPCMRFPNECLCCINFQACAAVRYLEQSM